MALHGELTGENIHVPYAYSYADATARGAATGFGAGDVGKLALQEDDSSLWLLTATTPTWVAVGGGGAVSSVNGQTGTVVLDPDDLDDSAATHKFTTAANLTKLAGIEALADVTDATNVEAAGAVMVADTATTGYGFVVDEDDMVSDSATKLPSQQSVKAYVDAQVLATGTYTDEKARDAIGAALVAGTGVSVTVNDPADTITLASTITQYTDEMARDALGAALTAGAGITVTPNDVADTITIASSITQYTDEMARDALGTALTAGANITITPNDAGDTITIAATGGFSNPMTTAGDLIYEDATPAAARLPKGTDGKILTMVSGAPAWASAASGGSIQHPGYPSGRVFSYVDLGWASGVATVALTANRVYVQPFIFPNAEAITAFGVKCQTAGAAGKLFRLGLYALGADGLPAALIADFGTATADSLGDKNFTGLSRAVGPNQWVGLAVSSDGAPSISGWSASTSPSFGSAPGTFGTSKTLRVYGSVVDGAAALPDPFVLTAYEATAPFAFWITL